MSMQENIHLRALAQQLDGDRSGLVERWLDLIHKSGKYRPDLLDEADLRSQSLQILNLFLAACLSGAPQQLTSKDWSELYDYVAHLSNDWAQRGFAPSEITTHIHALKSTCLLQLKDNGLFSDPAAGDMILALDESLDQLTLHLFENYASSRETFIREQTAAIAEMATPVTAIWDDILLLPLVGILDSLRAKQVMASTLQEIKETRARVLILDILGVPAIDTNIAGHLIKLVRAARLMGCECVLTGLSPAIAQTIVHLGIDLGDLRTSSRLSDGLAYAFRLRGLQVTQG